MGDQVVRHASSPKHTPREATSRHVPASSRIHSEQESQIGEESPLLRRQTVGPSQVHTASSTTDSKFLNGTSSTRFWWIFSQILAVFFIAAFDSTIMASSHPIITSHFNASKSASWLSTAFLLTSTSLQPLTGRLSDSLGRKPLFIGCLGVFTAATLGCSLATSIETFILARAACGLGAGGVMALGSILMSDLIPIERRGIYQTYNNVNLGLGSALGAALGGAMADTLGWRWEFGVQVPVLLLCMAVAWLVLPADLGIIPSSQKSVSEALKEFDVQGSVLLTTMITSAVLGLSVGGNVLEWSHPLVVSSLVVSTIILPIFLHVEKRALKPIVPLRLVCRSPQVNLISSNFLGVIISNSILFNIPLYFQAVMLSSATSSGLRLIIPTFTASVTAAFVGFGVTWTGLLKQPIQTGTICFLIGSLCLVSLTPNLSPVAYVLALVPGAVGQGCQFPVTFIATLAVSSHEDRAVTTSALILFHSLGSVLGVTSSSLIVQNGLGYYLDMFVQGDEKTKIIHTVRSSVAEISALESPYKEQVMASYESALRLNFIYCSILAAISVLLIVPVKLPRLTDKKARG